MQASPPAISFDPDDEFAPYHLLAFMMAPFDETKQRKFLAMIAASLKVDAVNHIQRHAAAAEASGMFSEASLVRLPLKVASEAYVARIDSGLSVPSGGLTGLLDSMPPSQWEEVAAGIRNGPLPAAGRLLLIVAQLKLHHSEVTPSLRRATAALRTLEAVGVDVPAQHGSSQIWKRYGCVAPLSGALIASMEAWHDVNPELHVAAGVAGGIRRVLSWAAWLRDFALNHVPKGGQVPLLTPDKALILPEGITAEQPPLGPLSPSMLAAARGLRAPIPAS
jgi:hypothetical protein